jgi:hypothetical protein
MQSFDPGIHGVTFAGMTGLIVSTAAKKDVYINRNVGVQKFRSGIGFFAGSRTAVGFDTIIAESGGNFIVPRQRIFLAIMPE